MSNLVQVRPIHSEEDYRKALARIDQLLAAADDTPEAEELEVISILVADYEEKNHKIESPGPVELIKFKIDQLGLKPKDVYAIFGASSRMSEVFSGKRGLSLSMIRAAREKLGIPADLLIEPTKLVSERKAS
jgi:HTH-type transcriptional regulator/antitoxin HigA